jgi:membrane protein
MRPRVTQAADERPAPDLISTGRRAARWSRSRRLGARIGRELQFGWRAAGRGVVEFYRSSNLTYAASIAYYTLLSLFPFLLLVVTIVSKVAVGRGGENLLGTIERALPSQFDFLVTQVRGLAEAPLELSVAGTLVTLWASMGVFGAVTSAVNHAWGVEKPHGFFKHQLIAFVMLMTAGLLLAATLVLTSAVHVSRTGWFAAAAARYPALDELGGFASRNAPTPLFVLIVGLIYYSVPNARVRLRDVWLGALLAGALWRLAFSGFAWYVRDLSRFSVHGSVAAVVVFLLWIYVTAGILLYGVEVTAACARLRKHLPQEAPAAAEREK